MIEVFEADESSTDSVLSNISTRSETRLGEQVQIAGFYIAGNQPKRVLIRALGPALTKSGVTGVLADPTLSLYSGENDIADNDDWSESSDSAEAIQSATNRAGAAALPADSTDSAIVVTLAPGGYTALVTGINGQTGVTLIEVYEVR